MSLFPKMTRTSGLALGILLLGIAPAWGALSATATISSVLDVDNVDFDYTILLKDTGTTNIGTFWFAWTPPGQPTEYDFLNPAPSSSSQPTGWAGDISFGFPAYSIEYSNVSGSPIGPGQTGTFGFVSSETPDDLQNGVIFGFPVTTSFIYEGTPTVDVNPPNEPTFQVHPTFVTTPEPSSLMLAIAGGALWVLRGRRRRRENR